jgi:hypothetical protein
MVEFIVGALILWFKIFFILFLFMLGCFLIVGSFLFIYSLIEDYL